VAERWPVAVQTGVIGQEFWKRVRLGGRADCHGILPSTPRQVPSNDTPLWFPREAGRALPYPPFSVTNQRRRTFEIHAESDRAPSSVLGANPNASSFRNAVIILRTILDDAAQSRKFLVTILAEVKSHLDYS
jgi:hypothetical protein